jgi:hypothetical protein
MTSKRELRRSMADNAKRKRRKASWLARQKRLRNRSLSEVIRDVRCSQPISYDYLPESEADWLGMEPAQKPGLD